MNKIEIGIPVYKALDLLPNALTSLLCQTNKNFDVCLAIDGDGLDYSQIIEDFKNRGLNIRVITSEKNMGCGYTRQVILSSTEAEYISYLDADDMLLPHAIDFFENCRTAGFECAKGMVLREIGNNMVAKLENDSNVTWLHGMVYSVKFLRENNIQFLSLPAEEDGHFNFLIFNLAKNIGETEEPVYFTSNNLNSITRIGLIDSSQEYTKKYGYCLFISLLTSLQQLYDFKIEKEKLEVLVIPILYQLYEQYQRCIFFGSDLEKINNIIKTYKKDWMKECLNNLDSFLYLSDKTSQYSIYNDSIVIPFYEAFFPWLERFFIND